MIEIVTVVDNVISDSAVHCIPRFILADITIKKGRAVCAQDYYLSLCVFDNRVCVCEYSGEETFIEFLSRCV